jgi:hypothetical protein
MKTNEKKLYEIRIGTRCYSREDVKTRAKKWKMSEEKIIARLFHTAFREEKERLKHDHR